MVWYGMHALDCQCLECQLCHAQPGRARPYLIQPNPLELSVHRQRQASLRHTFNLIQCQRLTAMHAEDEFMQPHAR